MTARRTLVVSCGAHALHDGYSDLIYVLLPVWQADFALGYAMLAVLRGLYMGAMALLQLPAGRVAERFGGRTVLAAGTAVAALGYVLAGLSGGLVGLGVALAIAGAGSSVQHPLASSAVSRAYAPSPRAALGTYNFSGDLGKAALPALISLLLTVMPWRKAMGVTALLGFVLVGAVMLLMPRTERAAPETRAAETHGAGAARRGSDAAGRGGFGLLLAIGVLDTSARMGLLTFLPFVLERKGASLQTVGLALALLFIGGAAGKFVCGWLGSRVGLLWTVLLTEGFSAAGILAVLALPLQPALVLMPVLGLMLNGTSSVLYGTVPELVAAHRTERAFAIFYTGVVGSGALSPIVFGALGDAVGPLWATAATALVALATLPLALAVAPRVARRAASAEAAASP